VVHTIIFKPFFDSRLEKIDEGAPIPDGVYASKTWPFCSACKKIWGAVPPSDRNMVFRKSQFYGYNCTSKSP